MVSVPTRIGLVPLDALAPVEREKSLTKYGATESCFLYHLNIADPRTDATATRPPINRMSGS